MQVLQCLCLVLYPKVPLARFSLVLMQIISQSKGFLYPTTKSHLDALMSPALCLQTLWAVEDPWVRGPLLQVHSACSQPCAQCAELHCPKAKIYRSRKSSGEKGEFVMFAVRLLHVSAARGQSGTVSLGLAWVLESWFRCGSSSPALLVNPWLSSGA